MNKARRATLTTLQSRLATLLEELEAPREEERDAFDNLPEGLQQSERGQAMEAALAAIEQAEESINEAITALEEAQA